MLLHLVICRGKVFLLSDRRASEHPGEGLGASGHLRKVVLLHAPGLAPFRSSSLCPCRLICEGSTALQRFTCKITLCNSELIYRPFPCVWEHLSIREKVVLLSDRRASEHPGEGRAPSSLCSVWQKVEPLRALGALGGSGFTFSDVSSNTVFVLRL